MTSYALDEMTWPEVKRHLATDARLMIPVGALAQHGPHLPLGANILVAERVVAEVSNHMKILRAPTFPYGVIPSGDPFSGASGLGRKTLHRAINEMLAGWEECGVDEIILVTAHRYEPHLEAMLMALSSQSVTTVYDLFQIDVSDILEGHPEMEHGGELETSLLLYLAADRVRMAEATDYVVERRTLQKYMRGRMPTPPTASRGTVGRPRLASEEKGAKVFARYVATLSNTLHEEHEAAL